MVCSADNFSDSDLQALQRQISLLADVGTDWLELAQFLLPM